MNESGQSNTPVNLTILGVFLTIVVALLILFVASLEVAREYWVFYEQQEQDKKEITRDKALEAHYTEHTRPMTAYLLATKKSKRPISQLFYAEYLIACNGDYKLAEKYYNRAKQAIDSQPTFPVITFLGLDKVMHEDQNWWLQQYHSHNNFNDIRQMACKDKL